MAILNAAADVADSFFEPNQTKPLDSVAVDYDEVYVYDYADFEYVDYEIRCPF